MAWTPPFKAPWGGGLAYRPPRGIALYGALSAGISGVEAQRELGQRRGADVGFRANTGRSADSRWMSAHSHKRKLASPTEVER